MSNQNHGLNIIRRKFPSIRICQGLIQDFLIKQQGSFLIKKRIHFLGKEFDFRYILNASEKLAAYLQELGIEKGDRVAIMLPNTPQAVISFYGILMAGGVVVHDKSSLYRTRTSIPNEGFRCESHYYIRYFISKSYKNT